MRALTRVAHGVAETRPAMLVAILFACCVGPALSSGEWNLNSNGLGASARLPRSAPLSRNVGAATRLVGWPGELALNDLPFQTAVFDGALVWLIPLTASHLVYIDPRNNDAMTAVALPPAAAVSRYKFAAGAYDGEGIIWVPPHESGYFMTIDVTARSASATLSDPSLDGTQKYHGAAFDGDYVWCAPFVSRSLLRIDRKHRNATSILSAPFLGITASNYFDGIVFDGSRMWLAPGSATNVLSVDIETLNATSLSDWPANVWRPSVANFVGGCYDGARVWLSPYHALAVVYIDVAVMAISALVLPSTISAVGGGWFYGAFFDGAVVWMMPANADSFALITPPLSSSPSAPEIQVHRAMVSGMAGGASDGLSFYAPPIWKVGSAAAVVKLRHDTATPSASVTPPSRSSSASLSSPSATVTRPSASPSASRSSRSGDELSPSRSVVPPLQRHGASPAGSRGSTSPSVGATHGSLTATRRDVDVAPAPRRTPPFASAASVGLPLAVVTIATTTAQASAAVATVFTPTTATSQASVGAMFVAASCSAVFGDGSFSEPPVVALVPLAASASVAWLCGHDELRAAARTAFRCVLTVALMLLTLIICVAAAIPRLSEGGASNNGAVVTAAVSLHMLGAAYLGPAEAGAGMQLARLDYGGSSCGALLTSVGAVGVVMAALFSIVTLVACARAANAPKTSAAQRRLLHTLGGVVLREYYSGSRDGGVQRHVWAYAFEDLLVAHVLSVAANGLPTSAAGCVALSVIMLLVALAHLTYLVAVRPYEDVAEQRLATANAALTVLTGVVSVIAVAQAPTASEWVLIAMGTLSLAANAYFFAQLLVLIAVAAWRHAVQRRRAASTEKEDADPTSTPLLLLPSTMMSQRSNPLDEQRPSAQGVGITTRSTELSSGVTNPSRIIERSSSH